MDGSLSEFSRLRLAAPRSALEIGLSHFRGFGLLLGILGLGYIAIASIGKQSLDEQIRFQIERDARRRLSPAELTCDIGSARYVAGSGLILNDVRVGATGAQAPWLTIDQLSVGAACGLRQLVNRDVAVCSVDVNRAHCVVERDAEGAWNIAALVKAIVQAFGGPAECRSFPIRVRQSSLELRLASPNETIAYSIRDIQCVATPTGCADLADSAGGPTGMKIQGSIKGNGFDQIAIALELNPTERTWMGSIGASGARIDSHLVRVVSQSLQTAWQSEANFRALVDVQCSARGQLDEFSIDDFQCDGKLSQVSFGDPAVPLIIRDGRAEFRLSPRAARAWNVSAQTDQGAFSLEYEQEGPLTAPTDWRLSGEGRHMAVDRRWLPLLPESAASTFQKWSPEGVFDLHFDLQRDANGLRPTVRADLTNASFSYEKLPYRLEHCIGSLDLKGNQCDIDLQALEGDHVVRIAGRILDPGAQYSGFVDVLLDGRIPLDEKLRRALAAQPKVASVVERFHATGHIGVQARIGRTTASEKTQQDFRVQLIDCAARHDLFDYPFYDVNGLVRIRNDRVDVTNVAAVHGNGQVRCDGVWSRTEGLKLQFLARTVALDDALRSALQAAARQRWMELRPRGVMDLVQVNLTQPTPEDRPVVSVDAQAFASVAPSDTSVTIEPTWFPFPLHNVTGRFSLDDRSITLQEVRGQHDRMWLSCNGSGTYDATSWEMRITDLFVSGLEANDQFLAALPGHLGQTIRRAKWRGHANARGEIAIAGEHREALAPRPTAYVSTNPSAGATPDAPPRLAWALRFETDGAACDLGIPLEQISGGAELRGAFDGQNLQCRGEIDLDSLMIGSAQLNRVRGPIWLDQSQCAFGTLAPAATASDSPRSLVSEFYGGQLRLDGRIGIAEDQPFLVQAVVSGCDMAGLSDDLIPRHKNLLGTGFASVRLTGDRSGRHSWRGEGTAHLRNAQIEVPVMSAVGQVVRMADFEHTVFDESNIDFELRGDDIDVSQVEFIGRPISLIGQGKIIGQRNIDLDFYTILGRNKVKIPVISELYHASSQQFLHIKVDGDIDSPRTHKTVLPGINEPLQRLMSDLEGRSDSSE
jgi:hypothetical protein